MKQEKGNCPCCRKEMSVIEDFPQEPEDDEGDEDDDYCDDDEEEEVSFTRAELNEFLQGRGGSGLNDAMASAICEESAVFDISELNALTIGNGGRAITDDEWDILVNYDDDEEEEELQLQLQVLEEDTASTVPEEDTVSTMQVPEEDTASTVPEEDTASTVQVPDEDTLQLHISSTLNTDGIWVRTVKAITSTDVTAAAAVKVQSVWRGFKMRNAATARLLMLLAR
jgi:hypothetical protein